MEETWYVSACRPNGLMRISRLFIKHHFNSQLLCWPAECKDTDELRGWWWGYMEEKVLNILLIPVSQCVKAGWTTASLRNLLRKEVRKWYWL